MSLFELPKPEINVVERIDNKELHDKIRNDIRNSGEMLIKMELYDQIRQSRILYNPDIEKDSIEKLTYIRKNGMGDVKEDLKLSEKQRDRAKSFNERRLFDMGDLKEDWKQDINSDTDIFDKKVVEKEYYCAIFDTLDKYKISYSELEKWHRDANEKEIDGEKIDLNRFYKEVKETARENLAMIS